MVGYWQRPCSWALTDMAAAADDAAARALPRYFRANCPRRAQRSSKLERRHVSGIGNVFGDGECRCGERNSWCRDEAEAPRHHCWEDLGCESAR